MRVAALAVLVLAAAGCEQKSASSQSQETADAGSAKVEGKVEKAFANAVKARGVPAAASSSGPPADGIMEPARADAEVPPGAPPQVTVGSEGTAPKLLLRNPKATLPATASVELTIQGGSEQGLPPITVELSMESKKAKVEKSASFVVAKIKAVRIGIPNVPKEFADQLAGLKGGKIGFSMTEQGAGFGYATELASGAKPELKDFIDAVAEGLSMLALPVPSVPVGAGAVWMVVSRDTTAGFGFMSYRMVKLVNATDKTAELEFDARRYATTRAVDPALLPPGSQAQQLVEMSAGSKARLKISVDRALATELEGDSALRGTIGGPEAIGGPPGQRGAGQQRILQSATAYRISTAR